MPNKATKVSLSTYREDCLYPRIVRATASILEQGKVFAPADELVRMDLLIPSPLHPSIVAPAFVVGHGGPTLTHWKLLAFAVGRGGPTFREEN